MDKNRIIELCWRKLESIGITEGTSDWGVLVMDFTESFIRQNPDVNVEAKDGVTLVLKSFRTVANAHIRYDNKLKAEDIAHIHYQSRCTHGNRSNIQPWR